MINEIDGYDHQRTEQVGVPAIFGMNFQTVSTAREAAELQAVAGGPVLKAWLPARDGHSWTAARQRARLHQREMSKMVAEIQAQGLQDTTAIILSAKHGQSPQNPNQLTRIDDGPIISAINAAWAKRIPARHRWSSRRPMTTRS